MTKKRKKRAPKKAKQSRKRKATPIFGLNGNFHEEAFWYDTIEDQTKDLFPGVRYKGDGEWKLPSGYAVDAIGGDDWILTDRKDKEWHVWTEEHSESNPRTGKHPVRRTPANLAEAVQKRKEFAGIASGVEVCKRDLPKMDSLILLGTLPEVLYESDKFNGRKHLYRHKFPKRERPILTMHPSGKYMVLIPPGRGRFKTSKRGIL